MRRSGALTLGVVLTLGGVTGGRGQELSGSLAASNAPPLDGFVLPTLPENWADLPFRLKAFQAVSYNSNINSIPLGSPVAAGESRGDFTSTTNVGFSTNANVYGQGLYLDATIGVIHYLHQTSFDSNIYSVNAGDHWTLTSRCSGNLGVSVNKANSTLFSTVTPPSSVTPLPLQRHPTLQRHSTYNSSRSRRQLHDDDLVQRNWDVRGLQRIFVGVQFGLERGHKLEPD